MLKRIFIVPALLTLVFSAFAQQQTLTLQDAILGGYTKFRPKTIPQLSWRKQTNELSWVSEDTANPALTTEAIGSNQPTTILGLNELKSNEALKDLKRFPRVKWSDANTLTFKRKGQYYSYNTSSKELKELFKVPQNAANIDPSKQNDIAAYTVDNNLWLTDGSQITNDEDKGIVNGQSVHRFEFGIHKGTFWSHSGQYLAFYRKDETMVTEYPLANYTSKPAALTPIRYPMAGMKSHHVTIGIWNHRDKKTVWLKTGLPADQYLTNVAWAPNDETIYVAILNRDQNEMNLKAFDPNTGEETRTIFTEKHEKYVQPLHPMEFLPNDNKHFIWQSERDGYNNLYLYTVKGKMVKQLTKHTAPITDVQGIYKDGIIYYTVADNNGMDRIIYRLNMGSGKTEAIAKESGVHTALFNSDGTYWIDYYTSMSQRLNITVNDATGKPIKSLVTNENPYEGYNVRLPELGTITTNEGITLNTRIFKPFDFDPNKKYKALVYVYNGPGVQLITNRWMGGAPAWMSYMANKGYIVFTVDGRGSENRGREFEQAIFRQLGELEVVDQLSGVEYLRNQSFVDSKKMAVHGWSYGGFMATSLMLKAPGIFQVGVAGGPVIDWKYYEIMYTERYMDTPENNVEGFARASLLDKVQNLKGDLMLIHGADDDVVVPQHSLDFIKHAVDKGVQIDFFIYPGHKHNVRGKDRVHLMEKVLEYIDEKLE